MRVTVLAGGTGGAKMAHGFQLVLQPGELNVVVNVADDTQAFGLHVSPDLDSVMYSLAGLIDREHGWGVEGDTDNALRMLGRYGEATWFHLGDADLATCLRRTRLLESGASLTDVTAAMAASLGVPSHLLPATDHRVRTVLHTDEGELPFQQYFVARRQEPEVTGVRLDGVGAARPTQRVLAAVAEAELIVLAPSNPFVSIEPILAMPGMRDALAAARGMKVGISPIVGGRALKGPAARMLSSLGHEPSALGVARLYRGAIDGFVLDETDASLVPDVEQLGMLAGTLPIVMRTDRDRASLAWSLLEAVRSRATLEA